MASRSRRSAGLVTRTGEGAALTGGLVLVTGTSAPGNVLVSAAAQAPAWQFVYLVAALVPAKTTSTRLIVCYGGSGLGYEFAYRVYPDIGFQLVLCWEDMRANMPGPLSVYAETPADASTILVKFQTFAKAAS